MLKRQSTYPQAKPPHIAIWTSGRNPAVPRYLGEGVLPGSNATSASFGWGRVRSQSEYYPQSHHNCYCCFRESTSSTVSNLANGDVISNGGRGAANRCPTGSEETTTPGMDGVTRKLVQVMVSLRLMFLVGAFVSKKMCTTNTVASFFAAESTRMKSRYFVCARKDW